MDEKVSDVMKEFRFLGLGISSVVEMGVDRLRGLRCMKRKVYIDLSYILNGIVVPSAILFNWLRKRCEMFKDGYRSKCDVLD